MIWIFVKEPEEEKVKTEELVNKLTNVGVHAAGFKEMLTKKFREYVRIGRNLAKQFYNDNNKYNTS